MVEVQDDLTRSVRSREHGGRQRKAADDGVLEAFVELLLGPRPGNIAL